MRTMSISIDFPKTKNILTLFEPGYDNYLFETEGGVRLPYILKNAYILMKLYQILIFMALIKKILNTILSKKLSTIMISFLND